MPISADEKVVIGTLAGSLGIFMGAIVTRRLDKVSKRKQDILRAQIEATYPSEYWVSKAEAEKASVEKHRIEVESQERLTIDARNRQSAKETSIRDFEKNAPAEYWAHKKIEEEEKTRRHQMDLDDARRKEQLKLEREAAKRTADALDRHMRSLRG